VKSGLRVENRELVFLKEIPHKKGGPGDDLQPPAEATESEEPKEMEMEECTQKDGDETSSALARNARGLNAAKGMDPSHNEGRGT